MLCTSQGPKNEIVQCLLYTWFPTTFKLGNIGQEYAYISNANCVTMTAILKTHLKTHTEYAHTSRHLQTCKQHNLLPSTPEVWVHKVNPPNTVPNLASIFGNHRKRDFSSRPSLNSCQTPLLLQSEGVHIIECIPPQAKPGGVPQSRSVPGMQFRGKTTIMY